MSANLGKAGIAVNAVLVELGDFPMIHKYLIYGQSIIVDGGWSITRNV